ncbi:cupin domain-containing protein [uncultured Anaerotruncus sp.]|uniref:cupin domain-containing protein n=1 Tax=Anaerotruncus massiliensis (ex Liu et al. 2021) TaxID=2321404 RepID=UPI00280AFB3C|nr:cupin domain-containing protein [uncultured Anaerotruncus sp.]
MITRKAQLPEDVKVQMRGGDGEVHMKMLLDPERFCGHGRLFNHMVLAPGCSIGYHEHQGESETFYILTGEARYNDNGTQVTLGPGDCAHTASGQGHSIANAGETPLEFIALIVNS